LGITNPWISGNSDGGGACQLKANRSARQGWENFQFTFVADNDGNGYLSRGDKVKLIQPNNDCNTAGTNVVKLSGVGNVGEDWFNVNDDGEESVFTICDSSDCSTGSGSFYKKGNTICLDSVNSRSDAFSVLAKDITQRTLKANYGGTTCEHGFLIDW
jgi:hypothetical protein